MNSVEEIVDYDYQTGQLENERYQKILEKLKIIQEIIALKRDLGDEVTDTNQFVQENIKSVFKLNEEFILLQRKKDDETYDIGLAEGFENQNETQSLKNETQSLKNEEENQVNVFNLKKTKDQNSKVMCKLNQKYFIDNDSFENLNLNKSLLPLNNELFIN